MSSTSTSASLGYNSRMERELREHLGQILMTAVLQGLVAGQIADPVERLKHADAVAKAAAEEIERQLRARGILVPVREEAR